jgi:hypothetical protein
MMLSAPLLVRRILAVGILLLPILLVWLLAVQPMVQRYSETQEALERSLHLLSRYRANTRQKEGLERTVLQRRQAATAYQGLIEAPNAALAASALQSGLRRILEASGGSVRVLSVAPPFREQGYDRLAARAEINVSAEKLINVLHALEASQNPNLSIDAVDIRAPEQAAQGSKANENASLSVRLDVSGFWESK